MEGCAKDAAETNSTGSSVAFIGCVANTAPNSRAVARSQEPLLNNKSSRLWGVGVVASKKAMFLGCKEKTKA